MSSAREARHAITGLRTTLETYIATAEQLPGEMRQHSDAVYYWHRAAAGKIESLDHCAALLAAVNWPEFSTVCEAAAAPDSRICDVRNETLTIQVRGSRAYTFVGMLVEHLTSTAKNLTDVFAALLKVFWSFPGTGTKVNLRKVCGFGRTRSPDHPVVDLIDHFTGDDGSWLSVCENVRNASQHGDSTTVLVFPFRQDSTEPPYLESRFYPRSTPLQRRLDNLCPWIETEVYRFVEELAATIGARPTL